GVVRLPEDLEQRLVGQALRVERDQDQLGVAGEPGAHFLVGRIGRAAAAVADGRGVDARRLPEPALGAPEAAEAQLGELDAFGEGRLERIAVHVVPRRNRHLLRTARQRLAGLPRAHLLPQPEPVRLSEYPVSLVACALYSLQAAAGAAQARRPGAFPAALRFRASGFCRYGVRARAAWPGPAKDFPPAVEIRSRVGDSSW